jgi:thiol:disulfide interchange protein DsbA
MNRREFSLGCVVAAALALLAGPAAAQGEPVEGREYTRLKEPVPVAVPGKVEVIEFFGYWCPHCASLEPTLEAWERKLPPDVNFRRIPIAFSAPQEHYQKLYFAIEALGAVPALQAKVFTAMHANRQRLDKEADIAALAKANGVDGAKLVEAMKSFTVATKVNQAKQLAQAYRIDSVPTLAVQGRYLTSVSQAGTPERTFQVIDALIQRSRSAK